MIKIHVLELEKLRKNLSTYQYPLLQPLIECVNKLEIRKKKHQIIHQIIKSVNINALNNLSQKGQNGWNSAVTSHKKYHK